ncbi:hypothetical protein RFI_10794 [Reticulomyxa filosa]|uniref:Tubulin alpha chain n=1 Tax=Reticulomyxa filosa TaxID=46433 RepID=X6NKA6_RETFI|nr:hypothetical protein RFI_10794 [Reticulomyxa filosa]|eukprot:ETO26343.1 hypothetical protein RFI_10794 [Reticulomyxa filosa]
MREVITIEVGQAGIQLGNALWEQYCAEHCIDNTGERENKNPQDSSFQTFFGRGEKIQFFPRLLAVDLEPNVIDELKVGSFAKMYQGTYLLSGNEDAANNFARGYYTVGRRMIDKVNDTLRKLVDNCDNPMGFMIVHSVGGGTGSGLGSLLLERLAVDYRKKSKMGFEIYPSPSLSTCVVEPYNTLLTTHWLIDHTDVSLVLDNEAIYGICQNKLHIAKPDVSNLNRLISKVVSSVTAFLRFQGELNVDLNEFQANLVPFPRLHFMTTGMSPIASKMDLSTAPNDVQSITDECLKPTNWLVQYTEFDCEIDKYMAISINYRGDIGTKDAGATAGWLRRNNKLHLVEWCPTGFKIGLNGIPPTSLEADDIGEFRRNAVMISNNPGISRMLGKQLLQKFDYMYSQQAFVHWYVGEEMEEETFLEAREDLAYLEKDYMDVLQEQPDDDYFSDDDYC